VSLMTKSFDRHPYLKHSTAEDMTFKPAHKDTQHPAGQIRPSEQELKGQQTLSDYIRSIKRAEAFDQVAQEKKITFKEWLRKSSFIEPDETTYCWLEDCWDAALKHGTLS